MISVINANVLDWAQTYNGELFHAVLCDPPYHLTTITKRFGSQTAAPAKYGKDGVFSRSSAGFMGKTWDGGDIAFDPQTWETIANLLHPGAFIFAFGGTRTYHRMAVAMEDAGLIIHPAIGWINFQGFPKATNIGKQIDKAAGKEREVVGSKVGLPGYSLAEDKGRGVWNAANYGLDSEKECEVTAPATPLAATWEGHRYGLQALKPAFEFICVAQKPYQGRPLDCITSTGAGAINIDRGRVGTDGEVTGRPLSQKSKESQIAFQASPIGAGSVTDDWKKGRWPSNLIIDDTEEVIGMFPYSKSGKMGPQHNRTTDSSPHGIYGKFDVQHPLSETIGDEGSAARFFYQVQTQIDEADPVYYAPKVSNRERNAGLESKNTHPTLKSIDLNRYLATLLLPPNEYAPRRILVPFAGAGSEVIGAMMAGWEEVVGVELENEYAQIAKKRVAYYSVKNMQRSAKKQPKTSEKQLTFAGILQKEE